MGSLDSPSAASGLEPGCVKQPEGLPGITGLSVTLRPFFSLWSRGTPPRAEGDLSVGGEEGGGGEERGYPSAQLMDREAS